MSEGIKSPSGHNGLSGSTTKENDEEKGREQDLLDLKTYQKAFRRGSTEAFVGTDPDFGE